MIFLISILGFLAAYFAYRAIDHFSKALDLFTDLSVSVEISHNSPSTHHDTEESSCRS